MNTSLKTPFISSMLCTFFLFPFLMIVIVFYHLFTKHTDQSLFFNSVSVSITENGFNLSINPAFFVLMVIVFIASFLITFAFQKKKK